MNDILSVEKERQILQGAAQIFATFGYEGASMSKIACAAGVSKGTLYNYFDNKAALFAAYVRAECHARLAMIYDGPNRDDIALDLREWAVQLHKLMFSQNGMTIYRVVMAEAGKFPELALTFYKAGPATVLARIIHGTVP